MPRIGRASARVRCFVVLGVVAGLVSFVRPVAAQSLVSGSIKGQILGADQTMVSNALVTVTNRATGSAYTLTADRRGRFNLALVIPGTYTVLAEQAGFQPTRQGGIQVRPGELSTVVLTLERRPPPIETVVDLPDPVHSALSKGRAVGQDIEGEYVQHFDFQQDVTGLSRDLSAVAAPTDGRAGYAMAAGGLPQNYSRLFVDGIEQNLIRHPGLPGEPASAPVFSRNSISGATALENGFDAEWDGTPGSLLAARSRVGSTQLRFSPYFTFSNSGLGGKSEDNPADQSTTSFQTGAVLSGALVRDTAHFVLGFNYQSLEWPTANPWEQDSTVFDGGPVSLRAALPVIAADTFGATTADQTVPAVRSYRGGNIFSRLDWRLSKVLGFYARIGAAKWKEQNPQFGAQSFLGTGNRLEARDISGAIGITSAWRRSANEFRLGVRLSKREWLAEGLPATTFVAEGAAIGISPATPADFDQQAVDINNTFQYALTPDHNLKGGVGLTLNKWTQDYAFGRHGIYQFGDLDGFGNGEGTFFQVVGSGSLDVSSKDLEAFVQDVWTVNEAFQFQLGIRYESQSLPSDKITLNTAWVNASGIQYLTSFKDKNNFAPRLGFVWDVQNRGEWVLRGGGGLYYTRMDLALFSEAALFDGPLVARRGQGTFSTWPATPDSVAAAVVGPRLTVFDDGYQDPRTSKWNLALSRGFGRQTILEVTGAYHHTDYIPRRTDLNLLASPTGQTQEGRPIYGTLVQQGGLVSAAPGSNRRFNGFDMVSGIVSNGFSDYYGLTVALERKTTAGLGFRAAYTLSKTKDNWLLGRSGDPADQFSPFPEDASTDEWVEGRSDLDIPHRLVLASNYQFSGRTGFEIGLRFRYRSGLAFTPGFRPGVDPNADGSGENDPAFMDESIAGVTDLIAGHDCLAGQNGQFAQRNSCREKAVHALDLRLSMRLPLRVLGNDLRLMVDAFNLVSTEAGIVDRAVYLVDPAQSLATDPSGNVTIPLIANPGFGALLSRRGEPRLVRLGLKVDY